ncbi:prefoldin subunit 4-like [Actinia tenebrosa]|uniref:Prefoldin subunit 4 n=1 Tax=Actinia tenebrosa TaxID=6105 RepID=A0A6P8HBZ4_ACTTE|nr:prefoldin subunit 4-like [Actinia tenebrosa]
MAAPKAKISSKVEDTNVTYEDQQSINTFARKNTRLQDLKADIQAKKKELQNLEDAGDELLMLDDENALIPYKIGEVFVNLSSEEVQDYLEKSKLKLQGEMKISEEQAVEIQGILNELKVKLYAKFGKNINLDAEDE